MDDNHNGRLAAGNYTLIVSGTEVVHYPTGSIVLRIMLKVMRGEHKGERCEKDMFWQDNPKDIQIDKNRFDRMGGKLLALSSVDKDAKSLIGAILSGEVFYTEHNKQRVYVHKYIGRDDPKKY